MSQVEEVHLLHNYWFRTDLAFQLFARVAGSAEFGLNWVLYCGVWHPSIRAPSHGTTGSHYSFLMAQKSSCFAAVWDLAPCPHSQCLFCYVLLMPTKFSCLAAAWDLAPCPHFHYLPNDLLHHQAGDRKGKVSNFRWLRDRKIGSGILSSSAPPLLHYFTPVGKHYQEIPSWFLSLIGAI